jgi:Chitobiase/beta-hexosaminidase C-terminal domain
MSPRSFLRGGTFTAAQSVSIADGTTNATIYYTTDGFAPTCASPVYPGAFSLTSVTTVQAIASASGYNNSAVTNAVFKFQTPAATYPITINVTATPAGSTKALKLNPIILTLIVT